MRNYAAVMLSVLIVFFPRGSTRSHVLPANTVVARRGRREVHYLISVQYSTIANWVSIGVVANPDRCQLTRKNICFPVSVRTFEFGIARQVWPSHPASARLFSNTG